MKYFRPISMPLFLPHSPGLRWLFPPVDAANNILFAHVLQCQPPLCQANVTTLCSSVPVDPLKAPLSQASSNAVHTAGPQLGMKVLPGHSKNDQGQFLVNQSCKALTCKH